MLKGKKHSVKRQTASEPEPYMIKILELLEQEFKITMNNILRACYDFFKINIC